MSGIREGMPVLARHAGEWEGEYIHVDPDNNVIDRHRSHLQCKFPDDGPYAYHQINTYIWDDGRREEIHFPAVYRDGQIWWDTDRIDGRAWEIDPRTVCLTWTPLRPRMLICGSAPSLGPPPSDTIESSLLS